MKITAVVTKAVILSMQIESNFIGIKQVLRAHLLATQSTIINSLTNPSHPKSSSFLARPCLQSQSPPIFPLVLWLHHHTRPTVWDVSLRSCDCSSSDFIFIILQGKMVGTYVVCPFYCYQCYRNTRKSFHTPSPKDLVLGGEEALVLEAEHDFSWSSWCMKMWTMTWWCQGKYMLSWWLIWWMMIWRRHHSWWTPWLWWSCWWLKCQTINEGSGGDGTRSGRSKSRETIEKILENGSWV